MTEHTCGIFLINNKKEILVSHATHSPYKIWGIPKGLADPGEDYLEAAVRELEEETGIKILDTTNIEYLGSSKYKGANKQLIAYYLFLDDLDPTCLLIVDNKGQCLSACNPNKKIDTIDTSYLWCRSMVAPRKEGEKPFPEVDHYKWVSFEEAEQMLYIPQKALLPMLGEILNKK